MLTQQARKYTRLYIDQNGHINRDNLIDLTSYNLLTDNGRIRLPLKLHMQRSIMSAS